MTNAQLMPPTHAETIRACGVGHRAHRFLHAHLGARPVVVIEAHEDVACKCCGATVGAGERVLQFDYVDDHAAGSSYLHPLHCARVQPRVTQPLAA